MTKLETTAYYEAINAAERLIIIDSTESKKDISEKITEKTHLQDLGTIHIEIFHKDKNIQSYSLIKFSENVFDLWSQKDSKISKSSTDDVVDFIYDNLPIKLKSPYIKFVSNKNDDGTYTIGSFNDETYEEIIDPKNISMQTMEEHILGQFLFDDGSIEYHCINNEDTSKLDAIIDNIVDDNIKLFAHTLVKIIPTYVFEIPAGISGKKNSASDLAPGGLYRHIINSGKIFLALVQPDYTKIRFTQHERDMMLVATIFSDALKHGWQEDYDKSHAPYFNHPRLMADVIKATSGILPINELNFIANCVETHMGQWGYPSDDTHNKALPMPDTDYKYFVHLANYLASCRDITCINDEQVYVFDTDTVNIIKSYTVVTKNDLNAIKLALKEPINMALAESLGIHHTESDIIDVWNTILTDEKVADKHFKYIELAKQTIFD